MIYAVNKRTKEHRVAQSGWAFAGDWERVEADADGWIPWEGGECPLPKGAAHEVKSSNGEVMRSFKPEDDCWDMRHGGARIAAYRPILDEKPEAPEWNEEAAEQLCRVYFEIAAEVIGEEQVRIRRDIKLRNAAAQRAEDEAVEAMYASLFPVPDGSDMKVCAKAIYAAIRDGKIPGVTLEGDHE